MGGMDGAGKGVNAPPGWYPDPSGQIGWRWWAGDHWTEHVAPMVNPYPGAGTAGQRMEIFLQAKQAGLDGFIRVAVWIWAVTSCIGVLVNWANIGYYRALWHWWHLAMHAIGNQGQVPAQPPRPLWSSLFSLASLGLLAIEVCFFVWQYRAAAVARALRYPARHSPGWGVGCWFVPIVNLWMPYQAIRDCLPPAHPARRHVLYAWLTLLITVPLPLATIVALVGAPTLGVVLVIVSVVALACTGLNAHRAVTAIAMDHRDAVAGSTPRT